MIETPTPNSKCDSCRPKPGIIDFRGRPPFGNLARDWIFELEDKPGNPGLRSKFQKMNMELPDSLLHLSMSEFRLECEYSGICHTVVPLRKLPTQSNDDLEALLAAWPGVFTGFAGLQPMEDGLRAACEEIEKYVIYGSCAGVYMEPGLDPVPWDADDNAIFPVYELCQEKNIPVCLLFGGVFHRKTPPDYDLYNPGRIERVARHFPGLRLLISHACWPFTAHACAVALNWENVWLSPDGFMIDHPGSQDYIVAANYRLQNKMIFGSLYPSMPMVHAVARYEQVLRPEVREKVFRKNAEDFLGKPVCEVGREPDASGRDDLKERIWKNRQKQQDAVR